MIKTTADDLIKILKEVVSVSDFEVSQKESDGKFKNFVSNVEKNYIEITDDDGETLKKYKLKGDRNFVNYEISLIETIMAALGRCAVSSIDNNVRFSNLAPYYLLEAIAEFVSKGKKTRSQQTIYIDNSIQLHQLISKLERWSQRTYEGEPTDLSFLIIKDYYSEKTVNEDRVNKFVYIDSVINEDFIATLSDVGSSCIMLDSEFKIVEHLSKSKGRHDVKEFDSPLFFDDINSAIKKRFQKKSYILLSLLSNGELLIIRDGALQFAKRRGQWRSFETNIIGRTLHNFKIDLSPEVSKKIYKSIIDVSFKRTGGCIAIINGNVDENIEGFKDLVSPDDVFDDEIRGKMLTNNSANEKKSLRNAALKKMLFNEKTEKNKINILDSTLSRKLLQEVMSIDGATIITTSGDIIAVGAIISLPPGSDSGGRTAAAIALSKLGAGIKISEDGEIKCYVNGGKEPEFIIG